MFIIAVFSNGFFNVCIISCNYLLTPSHVVSSHWQDCRATNNILVLTFFPLQHMNPTLWLLMNCVVFSAVVSFHFKCTCKDSVLKMTSNCPFLITDTLVSYTLPLFNCVSPSLQSCCVGVRLPKSPSTCCL